jgi:hypothetical protein
VIAAVWRGRSSFEYSGSSYTFDVDGKLLGYRYTTDVVYDCPNEWGTPCEAIGEPELLCDNPLRGEGGAGGAAGGQSGAGQGGV